MTSIGTNEEINDVLLIRQRHVKFDQRARRHLELLCEDRISRCKFQEVRCSLPNSVKSTFIMTFSPDGQRVASTHGDHRIYICELNTGKLLDTLEGHPKTPWSLAWHPTNREILASGCLAGEVRVWDLRSKACESWTSDKQNIISSLDFHPKERVLVIATANDIHFWDWSQSKPFAKTTTVHEKEKVKYVVFDSSGTKLITGIFNSPKFAGYSSDSLQNRIIDGYLPQVTIEPIPTNNMTQNSEIGTSPINGAINTTNENIVTEERRGAASSAASSRPFESNLNVDRGVLASNTEAAAGLRVNRENTVLLSRIAELYRQLDSLEDSMRNTSFAPYINLQPTGNGPARVTSSSTFMAQAIRNCQKYAKTELRPDEDSETSKTQVVGPDVSTARPGTSRDDSAERLTSSPTPATSGTFEPHLVTFDESLEDLQLPPLVIDGQDINLATIFEQHPIDYERLSSTRYNFGSIDQVNQNFIRISKLMSSARLYRQVVQQILSSNSGINPYQPNQILTAQSVTTRSQRNSHNQLPSLVSRNCPTTSDNSPSEANTNPAGNTTSRHDPFFAIESRNSARNVPLSSICKIELMSARAICILRSQSLIEQALAVRPGRSENTHIQSDMYTEAGGSEQQQSDRDSVLQSEDSQAASRSTTTSLQSLIGQLYSILSAINHAPLTTSNVYTHITSLRVLIEQLHKALSASLSSELDGRRMSDLMHKIAFNLTGRRWSVPLGATIDEIRLDVIHTLCIVDLTLHLTRQIQLLQMQRVMMIAHVWESQSLYRGAGTGQSTATTAAEGNPAAPTEQLGTFIVSNGKRTATESGVFIDNKRPRWEDRYMMSMETEDVRGRSGTSQSSNSTAGGAQGQDHQSSASQGQLSPERMLVWPSQPHNSIDQSLQRLFMATSSGIVRSNPILVRVYNRLPMHPYVVDQTVPLAADQLQPVGNGAGPGGQQTESRRRALSQDHNSLSPQGIVDAINAGIAAAEAPSTTARIRVGVRAPPAIQVVPAHGSNYNHNHNPDDAWQRVPHLHVYQTRGSGPHLWFNHLAIPLLATSANYRLQCWDFSLESIPDIMDSRLNVVTQKCRIYNDSSIDVSSNGTLVACLVPCRGDCNFSNLELKILSLRSCDLGACLHKLSLGPNAMSVSLSPSGTFALVGMASHKILSYDQTEDNLIIGKVFKMGAVIGHVRDVKIKRDDTSLNLNAIKWLPRGIVYNVGPQHHQRFHTSARVRNVAPPAEAARYV